MIISKETLFWFSGSSGLYAFTDSNFSTHPNALVCFVDTVAHRMHTSTRTRTHVNDGRQAGRQHISLVHWIDLGYLMLSMYGPQKYVERQAHHMVLSVYPTVSCHAKLVRAMLE